MGGGVLARWPWHWLANGMGAAGVPVALLAVLDARLHGPVTYYTQPVVARGLSYRHLAVPNSVRMTVRFFSPVPPLRQLDETVTLPDSSRAVHADSVRIGVAAGLFGPSVFTTFQLR